MKTEYQQEWRAKNPEKMKVYLERTKIRQKKNRAKIYKKEKEYWSKNKARKSRLQKEYKIRLRRDYPWKWWHTQIKSRCSNKALPYLKRGICDPGAGQSS